MRSILPLLRKFFTLGWRYRWYAVSFAWAVCLAGWASVFFIPYRYEASARLYVDSDAVLTPLLRGLALDNTPVGQLEILQRTLLSRPNLRKLISKTDLEQRMLTSTDEERMIVDLANGIKLTPQTKNLFTISFRDTSPKLSFDVVQTILSTFIESRTGNTRTDMDNARNFLQQQIDAYEKQLREAEQKRAEFRTKYLDVLPGADGGVSRMETAKTTVRQLEGALQDLMARRETISHELETTPPMLTIEAVSQQDAALLLPQQQQQGAPQPGPRAAPVNPRLAAAEQKLSELLTRYTDQHPDVVSMRATIAALRNQPAGGAAATDPAAPAQGGTNAADQARAAAAAAAAAYGGSRNRSASNPVYEQLRLKLVDADAMMESVRRQILTATEERDRLNEIARNAPGLQAEFINLDRDYDVLRRNFTEMLSRREAMRLASAADEEANKIKIQIVDPPQMPQIPVSPNRPLFFSAVLGAGVVGGIALVFLLIQFDRSFRTIDDLREFGFPIVGGISRIEVAVPRHMKIFASAALIASVIMLFVIYSGLLRVATQQNSA